MTLYFRSIWPAAGAAASRSSRKSSPPGSGEERWRSGSDGCSPTFSRPAKARRAGGPESAGRTGGDGGGRPLPLWVMSEEPLVLRQTFPGPDRPLRPAFEPRIPGPFRADQVAGPAVRHLVWALPPLIDRERLADYRRMIETLIGQGFRDWQVAHLGQLGFFAGRGCRLVRRLSAQSAEQPGGPILAGAGVGRRAGGHRNRSGQSGQSPRPPGVGRHRH